MRFLLNSAPTVVVVSTSRYTWQVVHVSAQCVDINPNGFGVVFTIIPEFPSSYCSEQYVRTFRITAGTPLSTEQLKVHTR